MWNKNIAGRFFGLVTQHACDRQTDGQNYDSQDRTSIAASPVKINSIFIHHGRHGYSMTITHIFVHEQHMQAVLRWTVEGVHRETSKFLVRKLQV